MTFANAPGGSPPSLPKLLPWLMTSLRRICYSAPPPSTAMPKTTIPKRRYYHRLVRSFVPPLLWIFLFTTGVSLIPQSLKPPINTTLLPRIDQRFFGNSATWFTLNNSNPTLDLMAAVPYTFHVSIPFVYLFVAAVYAPLRPTLPHFVFTFGVMNLAAVLTHLSCPTAPPWFYTKFGEHAVANYSIKGDPAALRNVDQRFHMRMFHHMYVDGGKVVFGAWPSLHAAWPYLIARVSPPVPPVVRALILAWVPLVWWAAIYLHHHYAADVVGGVLYAEGALLVYSVFFDDVRAKRKARVAPQALPELDDDLDDSDELPLYIKSGNISN